MTPTRAPKFVAYMRVSTDKQGRSGLGLDAQRQAIADYLGSVTGTKVAEFVEIESGKRDERPQLAAALHRAKMTGAKLIIAKLDRLSRNVGFIARLQESHVKFVCADMPEANELTVHLLAAIAQHERKLISERTRAALAAQAARNEARQPERCACASWPRERPGHSKDQVQRQSFRWRCRAYHRRHSCSRDHELPRDSPRN